MKRFFSIILISALTLSLLTGCGTGTTKQSTSTTKAAEQAAASSETITFSSDKITCSDSDVSIEDNVITISKAGNYTVSGSSENAQIIIDASDDDEVSLTLSDLTLSCETSAPIYVKKAKQLTVTLEDGSTNYLSTTDEFVAIDDNNIDGVIFSKDDLILTGSGSLEIDSPYGHGIVTKDELTVEDGTYTMTCKKHGLSGKDGIRIVNGTFTLSTQKDGIHTDGDLTIENGDINILESLEGLEGQTITILDGNIDIVSSDDGINAAGASDSSNNQSSDNFENQKGNAPQPPENNTTDQQSDSTTDNTDATADNTDMQQLPQNNTDGQQPPQNNSDGQQPPQNDTDGQQPPELPDNQQQGMEPPTDNGNGFGGNAGGFDMDADESCSLTISGGNIHINAGGDGIDSNGTFTMTGGTVFVEGPESNGDSALDYGISATITGGSFLAIGYSGMSQNFGTDSTQYSYITTLKSTIEEVPSTITLTDSEGNTILTQDTSKTYNCVIISCPELKEGSTYTLTTASTSQEFTPSSEAVQNN